MAKIFYRKAKSMNNIIPSILHVKCSGNLDIEKDLSATQSKSIAQLIIEHETKENK